MKWHDNKCVTLASNFSDVSMGKPVKRYDSKSKEFIEVPCPEMVNAYNLFMGGVDKNDMLIALYRSTMKPKKRWYLKIIFHMVDLCKVNAWLTYRRDFEASLQPAKDMMPLKEFIINLGMTLLKKDKDLGRPVGRPAKRSLTMSPEVKYG